MTDRLPRCLVLALVTLAPGPLAGQLYEIRPPPTTAACQAMTSALYGAPLPAPSDSAWYLVPSCPGGGAAVAAAIGSLARSSDPARLAPIVWTTRRLTDADVFEALRALATNAQATPRARATAFYGLIVVVNHRAVLTHPITTALDPMDRRCPYTDEPNEWPIHGPPLPSDHRSIIGAAARRVARNPSENPEVRAAARCVAAFMRPLLPPEIAASKVALEYICGNTFVVGNANADAAVFTYTVNGVSSGLKLYVPAGKATEFGTPSPGTVRLYYNGTLYETTENAGTPCS